MKKLLLPILASLIVLSGCGGKDTASWSETPNAPSPSSAASSAEPNPIHGGAIIDWVDFVKLNGRNYHGAYYKAISQASVVTDQVVGMVRFRIADVVTNPGYRIQDGDAAFLKEGTTLYRVKGFDPNEVIVAKDADRIGGYMVYVEDSADERLHLLKSTNLPSEPSIRIELYRADETTPYRTLTGADQERFLQLVKSGQDQSSYNTSLNGLSEPMYYSWVIYTESPFASVHTLTDDGTNVTASFEYIRILDPEIRNYLEPSQRAAP